MTLLLELDGANADEHSIKAAMKTVDSIVLIIVYVTCMVYDDNGNELHCCSAAVAVETLGGRWKQVLHSSELEPLSAACYKDTVK